MITFLVFQQIEVHCDILKVGGQYLFVCVIRLCRKCTAPQKNI